MTVISESTVDLKRPAWLLVLTLPAFVAFVAVVHPTMPVTYSAELTRAQLDDLGLMWPLMALLWAVPTILAAVGLAIMAVRLQSSRARVVGILATVAIVLMSAYVVIEVVAQRSNAATFGTSGFYEPVTMASLLASWFGVIPATLITAIALAKAGVARKTALTVVGLVTLYWVTEILLYLPVLLGSSTLAGMEGGVPPFLMGVFWAILGGGVLRSGPPRRNAPS